MAAVLIPTASQCMGAAGPILAVVAIVWFWRNGDAVMARLFPHWEWERKLGWLNLRATKRAERIMRGLTHLVHLALLLVLVGILAISWQLGQAQDTDNRVVLFTIALEWVYLAAGYGIWMYYFFAVLGPRLRDEFEAQELERYRLENPDLEREQEPKARGKITVWDAAHPRRF